VTIAVLALGGARPVAAAPTPVRGLHWLIEIAPPISQDLGDDCFAPRGIGWHYGEGVRGPASDDWGNLGFDDARGSWDPATGTGSVIGRNPAMLIDSFAQHFGTGHAWELDAFGIELSHGRAYISAQIRSAKTRYSAVKRQRLAVIAHPRLRTALSHSFSEHGRDLGEAPNTLELSLKGTAKITDAFFAATRRWRCRGQFANHSHGHVRHGEVLGKVTVLFGVSAATGLGGTLALEAGEFVENDTQAPITVSPTGAARTVGRGDGRTFVFDIPPGTRVPLECNLGRDCAPTGGGFALTGGLTFAYNGRSATVSDLAIKWVPTPDRTPGFTTETTLTGMLNGQPVTILTAPFRLGQSDDFLAALGNALGIAVNGGFGDLMPLFTSTGPL
jgi:hypothetical protein